MRQTRDDHLFAPGPKRILAIDGGGVRGALALGFLERIEEILQQRVGGNSDFRLCDYFDLIGGTSTGAIIAGALALGFSVKEIQAVYGELSRDILTRPFHRIPILRSKFPSKPVADLLRRFYGDVTLGSEDLQTGLMIMVKRLDTGSPWVLHNNPRGKYYDPDGSSSALPNRDFKLWEVVRASTAAPYYFDPERFKISGRVEGAFIDGGISPHNNPALQLFMLATLHGYGLGWPTGRDDIFLVSVGTGFRELQLAANDVMKMSSPKRTLRAISSIQSDCEWLVQALLQWMSRSTRSWVIDEEIGDLGNDLLGGQELLSYVRYTVRLEPDWLERNLGITVSSQDAEHLHAMDAPQNVVPLSLLGKMASMSQVGEKDFPPSFDIR